MVITADLKALANSTPEMRRNIMRRFRQMAAAFIVTAVLLFAFAWDLGWLYAWIYLAAYLLLVLAGALTLPPEVIAERGSRKENTEGWDKIISALLSVSTLGIYLIAGLDRRWRWSQEISAGWHIAAIAVFILGCAFSIWAMNKNRFFSTSVRIQSDRGHEVCTEGPYGFVRHPGYLGMIVYHLATPVFLGSLAAFFPAGITVLLYIIRTGFEDSTLQRKLPGYRAYAARTRYRLFPGLW